MPQFRIDVEGYLGTIPQAAFRPQDVLRELITNSLQSCAIAQAVDSSLRPRIDIEMPDRLQLHVTDNGIGFLQEVLENLGNLQVSKWDLAIKSVGARQVPQRGYGVFGMGLTSTINISRELLIVSVAGTDLDQAQYWWTDWKHGWQLWTNDDAPEEVPADVRERAQRSRLRHRGARVVLSLKDEMWRGPAPLDARRVEELVQFYFSAISMPIHVGGSPKPVNRGVAGWRMPHDDHRSTQEMVIEWLRSRGYDHAEEPQTKYQCFEILPYDQISGVMWIRPYRPDTVHFFAREVYGSDIPSLLPDRGGFVSAVVNDGKALLDITKQGPQIATMEGLRREESIRTAIGNALTDYISWLNEEYQNGTQKTKDEITNIGSRYGRAMLGYLLEIRTTRTQQVANQATAWIPFPIIESFKKRTLPECETPGEDGTPTIYYADRSTDLSRVQLFTQKYIVDARKGVDKAILTMYQQAHENRGLTMETVVDPAAALVQPVTELEVKELGYTPLLEAVREQWSGNVSLANVHDSLGAAFANIVRPRESHGKRELVLNKDNEALRILRLLEGDDLRVAASHIVQLSELFLSGHVLGEDFERASRDFTNLIVAVRNVGGGNTTGRVGR